MAAYNNDGAIGYGSKVLTINSVAYIAEDIEVTRGSNVIERLDEIGEPNGAVLIPTAVVGTATVQLPNSGSSFVAAGQEFTGSFGQGTDETFMITEQSVPYSNVNETKVRIRFPIRNHGQRVMHKTYGPIC